MRIAGPLGKPTKSASAPGAGLALGGAPGGGEAPSPSDGRWVRRQLREAARHVMPDHRVCICGEVPIEGQQVRLVQGEDGRGHYTGVARCGSVWVCPDCAAKVGRHRKDELRAGVAAARAEGLHVTMLTFTVGHRATDSLAGLLGGLTDAMRRWRGARWFGRWATECGYVGSVRNLEVTWGEGSGWHPHCHAIVFTEQRLTMAQRQRAMAEWVRTVERCGGYALHEVGLRLSDDEQVIAGYLSKADELLSRAAGIEPVRGWSCAEEVTLWHVKRGRADRLTPWDLLRALGEDGDLDAGDRFREYARAFAGRRQLVWSRGLRVRLGLGAELTDDEAAELAGDGTVVYAFSAEEWRLVRRLGYRDLLLDVVEASGALGVMALMSEVRWEHGLVALAA